MFKRTELRQRSEQGESVALAAAVLSRDLPGESEALVRLRKRLARLAGSSPGPVVVVLEGAPGVGKTFIARLLAVARAAALCRGGDVAAMLEQLEVSPLEESALPWFRSVSLPGLTESLAASQLFGLRAASATGVSGRIGIFEQAMTGAGADSTDAHERLIARATYAAPINLATGGVVLLDEIGDAPDWLQVHLLRLLNAEPVSRVHGEGDARYSFRFEGLVVLATWRDLDAPGTLRPDLRQRIASHRFRLPRLGEFGVEARRSIVERLALRLRMRRGQPLSEADSPDATSSSDEDPLLRREPVTTLWRSEYSIRLAQRDWSREGERRGLAATIEAILDGLPLEEAVDEVCQGQRVSSSRHDAAGTDEDLRRLVRYLDEGGAFSQGWLRERRSWAERMNRRLAAREPALEGAIRRSGSARESVKKQLENMRRSCVSGFELADE